MRTQYFELYTKEEKKTKKLRVQFVFSDDTLAPHSIFMLTDSVTTFGIPLSKWID